MCNLMEFGKDGATYQAIISKENEENKIVNANVTHGLLKTIKKIRGNLCQ